MKKVVKFVGGFPDRGLKRVSLRRGDEFVEGFLVTSRQGLEIGPQLGCCVELFLSGLDEGVGDASERRYHHDDAVLPGGLRDEANHVSYPLGRADRGASELHQNHEESRSLWGGTD